MGMMFNHESYNQKWIRDAKAGKPPFNDAIAYGVTVDALPQISSDSFRCIGVHHLTGDENRSNHNVFCDVLATNGQRMWGARLTLVDGGGGSFDATIDKPYYEPGTNFPLWSDRGVSVRVNHNGIPSDSVSGMHYGWPDEGPYNTRGHHSYYICYWLAPFDTPRPPIVIPPAQPQPSTITWFDGTGGLGVDDEYLYTRTPIDEAKSVIEAQEQQSRFLRYFE